MKHKEEFITEEKVINTPAGGVLIGKDKEGQTIIPNDGSLGGFLIGRLHKDGGIKAINKGTGQPLEMQSNEVIITAPAVSDQTKREFEGKMMTNREILSKINSDGGGVAFAEGGEVPPKIHTADKAYEFGGKMVSDTQIANQLGMKSTLKKGGQLFTSGNKTYNVDGIYKAIKKGKLKLKTKEVETFPMKHPIYDKHYAENHKIDFRKPNGIMVQLENGEEVLIDGNHRMNNAYSNSKKTMKVYYIDDPKEIAKYTKYNKFELGGENNDYKDIANSKFSEGYGKIKYFEQTSYGGNWKYINNPNVTRSQRDGMPVFTINPSEETIKNSNKAKNNFESNQPKQIGILDFAKKIAKDNNGKIYHKSKSGSVYVKVGNKEIRISNHHILDRDSLDPKSRYDLEIVQRYFSENDPTDLKYYADEFKEGGATSNSKSNQFSVGDLLVDNDGLDFHKKIYKILKIDNEQVEISVFENYKETGSYMLPIKFLQDFRLANQEESDFYNEYSNRERNSFKDGGHLSKGKSLKQIAEMHNVSLAHINEQLAKGLEVEKEHFADFKERTRVAKDHLVENPNYYTILEKAGLKDGGHLKPHHKKHEEDLVKDAKDGNTPARDLNNYNDLLDVQADGEVGGDSGIDMDGALITGDAGAVNAFADGGLTPYDANSEGDSASILSTGGGVDLIPVKRIIITKDLTRANIYKDFVGTEYASFKDLKTLLNQAVEKQNKLSPKITNNGGFVFSVNEDSVVSVNKQFFFYFNDKKKNTVANFNPRTGNASDLEKQLNRNRTVLFKKFDWSDFWSGSNSLSNSNSSVSKTTANNATEDKEVQYTVVNYRANGEEFVYQGINNTFLLDKLKSIKKEDPKIAGVKLEAYNITNEAIGRRGIFFTSQKILPQDIDIENISVSEFTDFLKNQFPNLEWDMFIKPPKFTSSKYPEYYEYTGINAVGFTRGKVYKIIDPKNLGSSSNFIDNMGDKSGFGANNNKSFKPSTEEAYLAQQKAVSNASTKNRVESISLAFDLGNVPHSFKANSSEELKKYFKSVEDYFTSKPSETILVSIVANFDDGNGNMENTRPEERLFGEKYFKPSNYDDEGLKGWLTNSVFRNLDFTDFFNKKGSTPSFATAPAKNSSGKINEFEIVANQGGFSDFKASNIYEMFSALEKSKDTKGTILLKYKTSKGKNRQFGFYFIGEPTEYYELKKEGFNISYLKEKLKEWFPNEIADEFFDSAYKPFDFTDTKIDVQGNPELSLKVQKRAFELGWEWENNIGKTYDYDSFNYLYFTKTSISYGYTASSFLKSPKREITEQDIFGNTSSSNSSSSSTNKEKVTAVVFMYKNNGTNTVRRFTSSEDLLRCIRYKIGNTALDAELRVNGEKTSNSVAYLHLDDDDPVYDYRNMDLSVFEDVLSKNLINGSYDWSNFFEQKQGSTSKSVEPITKEEVINDLGDAISKLEKASSIVVSQYNTDVYDKSLKFLYETKASYELALKFTPESAFMYERLDIMRKLADIEKSIKKIEDMKKGGTFYMLATILEKLKRGEDWRLREGTESVLTNHLPQSEIDVIIRSQKFINWFGNWEKALENNEYDNVSKALTNGIPAVFYHGARRIKYTYREVSNGVLYLAENISYALWFSQNAFAQSMEGNYLTECFVNIKNPIDLTAFHVNTVDLADLVRYVDAVYPLARIYDFIPNQVSLLIKSNQPTNTKMWAWQLIRKYAKFVNHIKENTPYDGFIYYENNPDDQVLNPKTGEYEENVTKAVAIFKSPQVKVVDAVLFDGGFDDWRFENGGKIKN